MSVDPAISHPRGPRVDALTARGSAWSVVAVAGRHVLSLAGTVILVRLLTPTDYGLLGMVATLTVFLQVLAEGGLSWATVQHRHLTWQQVHNLFAVNVALGAVLWLGCAAAGPALAAFYGQAELSGLATVLGATFLLGGIAVQPMALLQRRLRYRPALAAEVSSTAVGVGTGVALAVAGFGYWALVGQALAAQGTRTVLVLVLAQYRPRWPRAAAETGALILFGGYAALYGFVNYFARNLDNVLVGRVLGPADLGFYTRAYFLMTLPALISTQAVTGVVLPALAAVRDDRARFADLYRRATLAVAAFGVPLGVFLLVATPELVAVVYGAGWEPVTPLLVLLGAAAVTQPVHNTMGWLFLAAGKPRALFHWGTIAAATLAAGFLLGVQAGVRGVALAYGLLMGVVLTPLALRAAHRAAQVPLGATLHALRPVVLAAGVMAAAVVGVDFALANAGWSPALRLMAKGAIGLGAYALAGTLTRGFPRPVHLWRAAHADVPARH